MTRAARDPIWSSKGLGRWMLRRKMLHISRRKDRLTSNLVQRSGMITPITGMRGDVKGQASKVMWSVWCMFAHNSTTKCCRNAKIGRNVVRAASHIPHQFQVKRSQGRSMWLFKSPLAGGGGILWRPHNRLHRLFSFAFARHALVVDSFRCPVQKACDF